MFDRSIHMGGGTHHHNHNTQVTEKRAPTDESVRLLKEMQEKMEAAFVQRVIFSREQNDIALKFMVAQNPDFGIDYKIHYVLNLNGKELRRNYTIEEFKSAQDTEFLTDLIHRVSKAIATELVVKLAQDNEVNRQGGLG